MDLSAFILMDLSAFGKYAWGDVSPAFLYGQMHEVADSLGNHRGFLSFVQLLSLRRFLLDLSIIYILPFPITLLFYRFGSTSILTSSSQL